MLGRRTGQRPPQRPVHRGQIAASRRSSRSRRHCGHRFAATTLPPAASSPGAAATGLELPPACGASAPRAGCRRDASHPLGRLSSSRCRLCNGPLVRPCESASSDAKQNPSPWTDTLRCLFGLQFPRSATQRATGCPSKSASPTGAAELAAPRGAGRLDALGKARWPAGQRVGCGGFHPLPRSCCGSPAEMGARGLRRRRGAWADRAERWAGGAEQGRGVPGGNVID